MKIGFSQTIISPQKGVILAGYAVDPPRKNIGIHDDLFCKSVVFENNACLYCILILDIMCADESLINRIADKLKPLNIKYENLIVAAIHTHSGPSGVILGEGELSPLNNVLNNIMDDDKTKWLDYVVDQCYDAVKQSIDNLANFQYRIADSDLPLVGTDRNDGSTPKGHLHVIEFKTDNGKSLIMYNFPCHPTVMNLKNLYVSADFAGQIPKLLNRDISIFINGAAGDVSTRFTRKESSFEECERLASFAADAINNAINSESWKNLDNFSWRYKTINLALRDILDKETCLKEYKKCHAAVEKAIAEGMTGSELRVIKSFEEGASQNLKYSDLLRDSDLSTLHLPVVIFNFDETNFVSIPGELFSSLLNREDIVYVCYANGYYRYIPDINAFEKKYYEALGSIIKPGQGEFLIKTIEEEI